MTTLAPLEKETFLFAGVMGTDTYFVDAYVDGDGKRILIDDQNLIKAIKALLIVIPDVVGDEQAIGAALEFIDSPVVHMGLRDVTDANGGYANWMTGLVQPDGSVG